ncbi:MAG: hypothetical protein KJO26_13880 [Deltaproteobacteria bacterium]|nr:hypothetical protein [Deltaproteobacteria bacterium]NNK85716.1 hypothetical protein [Desulfobacterales bacterium]
MKVTFESNQKYILVHAKGKIKPQAAKELFVRLLGFCTDKKIFKVIVDYRDVVGYPTIIDRLDYLKGVDAFHQTYLKLDMPKLRIAYVAPINLEITEPVVVDQREKLSFDSAATHDFESAKKWIMKEST